MPIAQPVFEAPDLTGWYVGLVVGSVAVVVVVAVVATILTLAARIARQARAGIEAVEAARRNTLALWRFDEVTRILDDIRAAAEHTRVERKAGR